MRVAVRIALVMAALAGVAIEVWAVRAGWSWAAATLDLLAGWSLLAASARATYVTPGCRALLASSGVLWFLATPQVVGGYAGHDAALLGGAWLAPLATALLGSPGAVPTRWFQRGVAAATWIRALPALAGIAWLTLATGGCLAAAALADSRQYAVRVSRTAGAVVGVLLGVSGLLQALASRGSDLEPLVAVGVAASGLALIVIRPAPATTDSGFAGLVVELGSMTDARSLERRLARAIGDPQLRVLYQLAPGMPYVSAAGVPAAPAPEGRVVTVMGQSGPVLAALEHDGAALADPELRQAVLAVGRLAVRRLVRASEAALQAVELAESRRRLIETEGAVREQFARDVADGPYRSLTQCLALLDEALPATPAELLAEVSEARAVGQAAGDELARTAAGDVDRMLARRGLAAALLDLASAAGAGADVRIDGDMDASCAIAAWFAASEALTNALKHAGPARIWLSAVTGATSLRVEVADDGVGGADPDGQGLRGLRERLAAQGARLHVTGAVPAGTRVVAEIPLCGSAENAGAGQADDATQLPVRAAQPSSAFAARRDIRGHHR
jgi:signal transduction histidine kinase